MTRTFTGQIEGLEVGSKFIVITMIGSQPRGDTAPREVFTVVRREERYVVANESAGNIEEQGNMPRFETHTSRNGAPLFRCQ